MLLSCGFEANLLGNCLLLQTVHFPVSLLFNLFFCWLLYFFCSFGNSCCCSRNRERTRLILHLHLYIASSLLFPFFFLSFPLSFAIGKGVCSYIELHFFFFWQFIYSLLSNHIHLLRCGRCRIYSDE